MEDLTDTELWMVLDAIDADHDGLVDWVTRLAIEVKRHRASKLTEREERLAISALGYWSSDNDYAPHEQIAALRVKLSRPK